MPTSGSVFYELTSGKKAGPFSATLNLVTPKDGYFLDVAKGGKDYPTVLDFRKFGKVTGIVFKPNMGKELTFTKFTLFNHGQWVGDRFTQLG